jgi:hypothetical protein
MYPHERSLVKKMADKPFALVGVNSDQDMKALKPVLEKEQITWRSFQNGPPGSPTAISADWNVSGWPTVCLIDHKGVIRNRWLGPPDSTKLDEAVQALVKEAEEDAKK